MYGLKDKHAIADMKLLLQKNIVIMHVIRLYLCVR